MADPHVRSHRRRFFQSSQSFSSYVSSDGEVQVVEPSPQRSDFGKSVGRFTSTIDAESLESNVSRVISITDRSRDPSSKSPLGFIYAILEQSKQEEEYVFKLVRDPARALGVSMYLIEWMNFWSHLTNSQFWRSAVSADKIRALGEHILKVLVKCRPKYKYDVQIDRHRFLIHGQLGEIDAAYHDFDSYINCSRKGAWRKDATDPMFFPDNEDVALSLAVKTLRLLCRYCSRQNIARIRTVALLLQAWLEEGHPSCNLTDIERQHLPLTWTPFNVPADTKFKPRTIGNSFQVLGIAYATYAAQADATLSMRTTIFREALTILESADDLRRCDDVDDDRIQIVEARLARGLIRFNLGESYDGCSSFDDASQICEQLMIKDDSRLTQHVRIEHYLRQPANRITAIAIDNMLYNAGYLVRKDRAPLEPIPKALGEEIDDWAFPQPSSWLSQLDMRHDLDAHQKLAMIEQVILSIIATRLCNARKQAEHQVEGLLALVVKLFGVPEEPKSEVVDSMPVPSAEPPQTAKSKKSERPKSKKGGLSLRGRKKLQTDVEEEKPPLPEVPHNIPHDQVPPPVQHQDQPPKQDQRSPTKSIDASGVDTLNLRRADSKPLPPRGLAFPRFHLGSDEAEAGYRTAALISVWVFISKLYTADCDRTEALNAAKTAVKIARQQAEIQRLAGGARQHGRHEASEPPLGHGLVRTTNQLLADALAAEADALCIGANVLEAPYALMQFPHHRDRLTPPDAAALKRATTLYSEALTKDMYHLRATLGLCQRNVATYGLDEEPVFHKDAESDEGPKEGDSQLKKRARAEVFSRLRNVVEVGEGRADATAWKMLGDVGAGIKVQSPLGVDPYEEAQKWEEVTGMRPWSYGNASGFVLF